MPVDVTWWGHATVTLRDAGVSVLTDPLLVRRMAHLRRRRGDLPPESVTAPDAVLVSHLHADHLHVGSLAQLRRGTAVLVPRGAFGAVPGLRRLATALRLTEVVAGDVVTVGHGPDGTPVRVRAVHAEHDGRRLPYGPHRVAALGYVLHGHHRTYFAGDTGLFDGMAQQVGPVDTAILPVGGWGPRLGPEHLDARRAAQALARLRPVHAVPVHFGTYWPIGLDAVRPHEFHSPGDEFYRHALDLAPHTTVHRLAHGESVRVEVGA